MTQTLYRNATPSDNLIEDDSLIGSFKTPDQLRAEQAQKVQDAIDGLISAIDGVSFASMFIAREQKLEMLRTLVPLAMQLTLDAQGIDRVIDTFKANKWHEDDTRNFLEACQILPPPPKFKPLSLQDLLRMPPKEWLIAQVLGAGDIGMIYGAPGCGKTFVIIDMIFSACLGQQFARRFDVQRPLNVAYAAGEGISGLPARFAAAAKHYDIYAKTLSEDYQTNFTFFAATPQLYIEESAQYAESITQFVYEWKQRQAEGQAKPLDILIIDTLHSATAGADENSAQHMGIVLKLAKNAAQELGCAVLLVHHTNKNGTAERGSSALRGAMDCMIEIHRISETGIKAVMTCAKLKDGEQWQEQTLDLVECEESVRVWWDEPSSSDNRSKKQNNDVEAIVTLLKAGPGKRYTANSIAEAIGMGGSKQIFKLLPMAMKAEPGIKAGLKNLDKDSSPQNPMMYWFQVEVTSHLSQ
ncbi:hypothetical protein BH10CHL1_BH10CHL1_01630 [soil metagenome]